MLLYNTHSASAQPRKLFFESSRHQAAWVDGEGSLHILEAADQPPHQLSWYEIKPSTGHKRSVLNGQKLFCHMSSSQALLVHCASGRVLGMPDPHTLFVLDADTAQQLSCINVAPQHAAQEKGSVEVGNVAWSSHGEMLALSMHTSHPVHKGNASIVGNDTFISCEVRIYNTVTGQKLQTASLPPARPSDLDLFWSSSLNLLAVAAPGQIVKGSACRTLSIFTPVNPGTVNEQPTSHPRRQVSFFFEPNKFLWTPCGNLLIAVSHHGFSILNPLTYNVPKLGTVAWVKEPVYERPDLEISWASEAASGNKPRIVTAYLRGPRILIICRQTAGKWQAERRTLPGPDRCFGGCISPDANTLVILQQESNGRTAMVHSDQRTAATIKIATAYVRNHAQRPTSKAHIRPEWAPRVGSGRPLYACIIMHGDAARRDYRRHAWPQSVKLVDADAHHVLGSWTVVDLHSQASGSVSERAESATCRELSHLEWSADGQHLAVFSTQGYAWILTFDKL